VTCLLDTHFLIWIITESRRLKQFAWIEDYRPWGVSPVSVLEIQFLTEIGNVHARHPGFLRTLMTDPRFILDDVSFMTLTQKALSITWTRDPFDRLLAAHSVARRVPLCSVASTILENHRLILPELM
jgi:PIN domain nuclease of toxin-antitoxin system